MPAPDHTATPATDPALLRIEGPIATSRSIGRPPSTPSIFRSEEARNGSARRTEASDDIPGAGDWKAKRAFCAGGDLQTIGAAAAADTVAPVIGECCIITTPSSRRCGDAQIVLASVHGSAAGAGLSLAFVADLCIATEDARFTPAYAKLGVSP